MENLRNAVNLPGFAAFARTEEALSRGGMSQLLVAFFSGEVVNQYRSLSDLLFCELFTEWKQPCFRYYQTRGSRLISHTEVSPRKAMEWDLFMADTVLPRLKELVEELFAIGLIRVLYATETFAVGINMPAKAVCFNTLEKYDGITFRYLHTKEYFQLAGRAGRRGIDKEGYAIALFNRNRDDLEKIRRLTEKDVEPILSQFTLSYNTVLNLLQQHNHREIEIILKKSFDYYLKKKRQGDVRVMASFHNKVKLLQKMGYVRSDNTLTEKGEFARLIYAYELLIAELCTSGIIHEMNDIGFLTTLAAIMFEGRRGVEFTKFHDKKSVGSSIRVLSSQPLLFKKINAGIFKGLHPLIAHWYDGGDFVKMMDLSNMLEGDYIRLFRQIIDMLKQIKRATSDYDLIQIIDRCTAKVDRDVVKVEL